VDNCRVRACLAVVPLLVLSCCGYSAKSLLPPHLRTVALNPAENSTSRPGIGDDFQVALEDAFNRDRNLRITAIENADLAVSTTVTAYVRLPSAYDAAQNITAYDLSVSASVDAEDRVKTEEFFSQIVSARITYDPESESEDEAALRAVEKLAEEVVGRIITTW